MERRRFVGQMAWLGVTAYASTGRTGASERPSRDRIIFLDSTASKELGSFRHEVLGRLDTGAWAACPDQTVRTLAEHHLPVFLYFERRGYDAAVAGLARVHVKEVIRGRRDRWAPQAARYVMAHLLDLEKARLEGIFRSSSHNIGDEAERSLVLPARLEGLDRYTRTTAKDMAVTVLEGESLLLATLQSAIDSGIADLSGRLLQEKTWVKAVCQAAATLGATEFANAPPFADASAGVFVHPADQAFERALLQNGEPARRWMDGVVCILPERRIASLRAQGHTVEVLYADASELYSSFEARTPAQLDRDFAARHRRPEGEVRQDRLALIDRLQLHQILMKRELRRRQDARRACESAGFDRVLREEVELLSRWLARTRSFSKSQGLDSIEPPAALARAAGQMVSADASLFAFVAARYWPSIAQNLQEISAMAH